MATIFRFHHSKRVRLSVARNFFFKNLLVFLICLCLPVTLLGLTVSVITQRRVSEDLLNQNDRLLTQIRHNFEMIIDDIDSLNLTFSSNTEMIGMLKQVLGSVVHSSNDHIYDSIIKNFLIASVAPRQYIHSIYIYWDNPEQWFFTSSEGLAKADKYFDSKWLETYAHMKKEQITMYNELRVIRKYDFEHDTELLTFYQNLFNENGLVVMNISKTYLENYIASLNLDRGQVIYVLDEKNQPILQSDRNFSLTADELQQFVHNQSIEHNGELYAINRSESEKYNWKYLTITPVSSINQLATQLKQVMGLTLGLVFIVCVILALLITRSNYRKLYAIISVLDDAEQGQMPPLRSAVIRNEYDYIIQNILLTYVNQNQLKSQLLEERYQMQILELSALQYQMNPHFLFNTLQAIFWMSFQQTGSYNNVSHMIENLSELLNYSMGKELGLVSMEYEIHHTESYLQIEQIRFQDAFAVTWDYPKEVLPYYTLRLILQPLLENAIQHGFQSISHKGKIRIRIREHNDGIDIRITDNGIGIKAARLQEIQAKFESMVESSKNNDRRERESIGLYNCHRRLILAFGKKCGLRIWSREGLGTCIQFTIPKSNAPVMVMPTENKTPL